MCVSLIVVVGLLAAGAGDALAKSTMRLTISPHKVNPGGSVSVRLRGARGSCRLTIVDAKKRIYTVKIRPGRTVIPFSGSSAAARLVIQVRCGQRTLSGRLSVIVKSLPVSPQPPATTPPVTTPPATTPPASTPPTTPTTPTPPITVTKPPINTGPPTVATQPSTPTTSDPAPTTAETGAVNWATSSLNSTQWSGESLEFAYFAYLQGAGVNLLGYTTGVDYTWMTTAQDIWGHTSKGTTGTGTPPYGSVVFFGAKSGYSPAQYSWVAVMGSGGELIATPDAVTKTVHNETVAQAATADPHSSYVGWWLPDGTS